MKRRNIFPLCLIVLAASMACMTSTVVSDVPKIEDLIVVDAPTVAATATVRTENAPADPEREGLICGRVNVRMGPAASGAVGRWLVDGDVVIIHEWAEGWVRIGEGEWVTERALCK